MGRLNLRDFCCDTKYTHPRLPLFSLSPHGVLYVFFYQKFNGNVNMNHNEEVPDFLGGLGDMLPADVLKKVNELLEQLHRKDKDNQGCPVFIYAPGSQYVDKQYNIGAYPRPNSRPSVADPSPFPKVKGADSTATASPPALHKGGDLPAPEAMVWAVEKTIKDGHWWGNVSWSVVYRIYQMKGYQGTVSQFVRDVSQWPFTMQIRYDCNDDAVGKPIRTGKISRSLDKWAEDGASSQFIILGEALMKALVQFRK